VCYQVEYENHSSFSGASSSAGLKKESPVRIFTNLDPATVVLPASEGYWFVHHAFWYFVSSTTAESNGIRSVCLFVSVSIGRITQQEAQLMLTNPHDVCRGQ